MKGRRPNEDGDPALGIAAGLGISLLIWAAAALLLGRLWWWWWS